MTEWLFEQGIGESRAALVDHGRIIEALIERDDGAPRAGAVLNARLLRKLPRGAIIGLELAPGAGPAEALLDRIPRGIAEGATLRVEIAREAIAEPGRPRLAKVVASDKPLHPGDGLRDRIAASGISVRLPASHGPDALEAAGWSELIDEALSGEIAFPGGALRMSPTPAMTLFDVDGDLALTELAIAGAAAAGRAIRRLDIGGSIGIDLPTVEGKAARQAAAAALDAALPQPFERTAVNGFGFLQIVRPRRRASLPELLRGDRTLTAALGLLRRAERCGGAGPVNLRAAPAVIARIEAEPLWIEAVARACGAPLRLRADPAAPICGGDVQRTPI